MKAILFLFFLCCTPVVNARELNGAKFEETVNVGRATLTLNGVGMRTATIFSLKVYAAGLYVAQPSKDPKALMEAQWPIQLQMEFMRNVESKDIAEAWQKSFDQNCGKDCESLKARFFLLKSMMPTVKKGDRMTYTFQESGVEITHNGKPVGDVGRADFSRFLLSTWLGENPPNEGLKKGLLGLTP